MQLKKEAAIKAGDHSGLIIGVEETTRVFDGAKGPKPVVAVTIQPKSTTPGVRAKPVEVVFGAVLDLDSGLYKLVQRLKKGDTIDADGNWNPQSLVNTEVRFKAFLKGDTEFVNIDKDTIVAA